MNPPATPPDLRFLGRPLAALSFAVLLLSVALFGGCSKPVTNNASNENAGTKVDPWKAAAARLKKDTDLAAAKQALATINSDAGQQEGEKLPAAAPEQLAALSAMVPLSPADREEISGAAFSNHDPAYVADCLYLRDAARALDVAGLPPERQADLAFAWVCRQVYLHPWLWQLNDQTFRTTALPPTAVLRRGYGSGLERTYVFLALLQQLGLDGCLIGRPEAGHSTEQFQVNAVIKTAEDRAAVAGVAPRGPFWAAGVRVGNDVRLFDPYRGQPFPVTLGQLKVNPDAAKGWFEDKANLSGAKLDDAKKATAFLAVPVNSLSPRMALFDAKMKAELGARFAFDLKSLGAMRAAFPDPKPAFWNPPDDPFAYGRASRSYLPLEAGGGDRTPASGGPRLYELSLREQIPASVFRVPADLTPGAAQKLAGVAATMLAASFLEPPNPRERVQRGRFQEAAVDLVTKQEAFARGLERLRTEDAGQQAEEIRAWVTQTNQLYDELTRAQSIAKDPVAAAQAASQIENQWKQRPAQLIVDKLSAEVGRAEAAYLLGLCKHEQAERLQVRAERAGADGVRARADALDAWRTARDAWRTYEQLSSAHEGFPGRAAHARKLSEEAAKFAQADAKKK
jgi:hypothetical protein